MKLDASILPTSNWLPNALDSSWISVKETKKQTKEAKLLKQLDKQQQRKESAETEQHDQSQHAKGGPSF